jgi:hypothetical protein
MVAASLFANLRSPVERNEEQAKKIASPVRFARVSGQRNRAPKERTGEAIAPEYFLAFHYQNYKSFLRHPGGRFF